MSNPNIDFTKSLLQNIKDHPVYEDAEKVKASSDITLLWHGREQACFDIESEEVSTEIMLYFEKEDNQEWLDILIERDDPEYVVAAYMCYLESYSDVKSSKIRGKIYERPGIVQRVIKERKKKARKLEYRVKLGKNLYDEHKLYGNDGRSMKVTIWDLEQQIGYVDNIDWKTNKIATTKHIIYLCDYINEKPSRLSRLRKQKSQIELTLDPLQDYQLTWKYNQDISKSTKAILEDLFGSGNTHLSDDDLVKKHNELTRLSLNQEFIVRAEVFEKIARHFDRVSLENQRISNAEIDYSEINAELFSYQKEGVEFCLFRQSAIIADEMGLGKTLQAISTAILKKRYLGFKKTLVICPASVKYQWAAEIEKFTSEKAIVISGPSIERAAQYVDPEAYFVIANYEVISRDQLTINKTDFDLIILDEAQRIKNFNTKTAAVMQGLNKQHGLVLTGTPIENKLIDIYSIVLFLDKYLLTPLWEFSYQHCVFDYVAVDKINGYFNLNALKSRLKDLVIRRQKHEVLPQLPELTEKKYLINLHPKQREIHGALKRSIASILAKKFKTAYDWERIMMTLTKMRRVSDSTYLIENTTNYSSKIQELRYILQYQLDVRNQDRKIIIFSEWLDSLFLIEQVLNQLGVGYTKLTGSIPTGKRGVLIDKFTKDKKCKVFLSTEAGGTGLNLQMADTVINFELPWNPAKKNQRIGRINRIGQKSKSLLVIDLICQDSIEIRIASGLALKQNLFDGVLNAGNMTDAVDFTEEGRAQFMEELREFVNEEPYDDITATDVADYDELFDDEKKQSEYYINPDEIEIIHDAEHEDLDWSSFLEDELDLMDDENQEEINYSERTPKEPKQTESGEQKPSAQTESPNSGNEPVQTESTSNEYTATQKTSQQETEQMEEVLNKGLEFLAGLYQMSTGKKMMDNEKEKNISIDKETGEVVLRFKLK